MRKNTLGSNPTRIFQLGAILQNMHSRPTDFIAKATGTSRGYGSIPGALPLAITLSRIAAESQEPDCIPPHADHAFLSVDIPHTAPL